jgi:hypothetical protein
VDPVIVGYFDPESHVPEPRVGIYISIPGIADEWAPVDFVIDTGASETCVHPADSMAALQIDVELLDSPSRWPSVLRASGIGGSASYFPVPASFAFFHDDGTPLVLEGKIDIARITHTNRRVLSLLGWDLLKRFEVVLNWPAGRVTLEPL